MGGQNRIILDGILWLDIPLRYAPTEVEIECDVESLSTLGSPYSPKATFLRLISAHFIVHGIVLARGPWNPKLLDFVGSVHRNLQWYPHGK